MMPSKKIYLGQNKHTAHKLNADHFPILTLKGVPKTSPDIKRFFLFLKKASHVIITSPSSAKFFAKLSLKKFSKKTLTEKQYLSLGKETSKVIVNFFKHASIQEAKSPIAEGLLPLILKVPPQSNVLYLASPLSRPLIYQTLLESSLNFHKICLYRVIFNTIRERHIRPYHEILFTSPSGVRAYRQCLPFFPNKTYSCIGKITENELKKFYSKTHIFSS